MSDQPPEDDSSGTPPPVNPYLLPPPPLEPLPSYDPPTGQRSSTEEAATGPSDQDATTDYGPPTDHTPPTEPIDDGAPASYAYLPRYGRVGEQQRGLRTGQMVLGVVACILGNLTAVPLIIVALSPIGGEDFIGIAIFGFNLIAIVLPAAKGYGSFAVGWVLGYVVAFVLAIGACFVLISQVSGVQPS